MGSFDPDHVLLILSLLLDLESSRRPFHLGTKKHLGCSRCLFDFSFHLLHHFRVVSNRHQDSLGAIESAGLLVGSLCLVRGV
jgi:hypothetical protein